MLSSHYKTFPISLRTTVDFLICTILFKHLTFLVRVQQNVCSFLCETTAAAILDTVVRRCSLRPWQAACLLARLLKRCFPACPHRKRWTLALQQQHYSSSSFKTHHADYGLMMKRCFFVLHRCKCTHKMDTLISMFVYRRWQRYHTS